MDRVNKFLDCNDIVVDVLRRCLDIRFRTEMVKASALALVGFDLMTERGSTLRLYEYWASYSSRTS